MGRQWRKSERQTRLRRPIVILGIALVVFVGLRLLPVLAQVLLVLFGAIALATVLDGASSWLAKHTFLPRWLGMALIVLFLIGGFTGLFWLMGDRINSQFDQISNRVTQGWQRAEQYLREQGWAQSLVPEKGSAGGGLQLSSVWTRLGGAFSTTFGAVANTFVLLVMAVYLAATPQLYLRNLLRLVPCERRSRYSEVLSEVGSSVRWWFVGQFWAMVVIGTLTGVGLAIVGVPMALSLGLIAGLLAFVPFVGPIVAAIPGVLVAWVQGPQMALYALGVYALAQLLESNLITPLIQKRAVSVPPALLIAGQLLLGSLFGFWGVLWATPLIVVLMVLVRTLYVEDVLKGE